MPLSADPSPLLQLSELAPGRRNGNGSQSRVPCLAQSLPTKPTFHASEQSQGDVPAQSASPARTQ